MKKWYGAAGLCVNERNQVLMVLQGRPEEEKTWSIPTGGKEMGESFEECCKRELLEETGYHIEVLDEFYIKNRDYQELGIAAEVHYFIVKAVGGDMKIQDPDELIYEIAWKSIDDIEDLLLTYPEDLSIIQDMAKRSRW